MVRHLCALQLPHCQSNKREKVGIINKRIINNNNKSTIPTSNSRKELYRSIFVTLPIPRNVIWQRKRLLWCAFCSFLLIISHVVTASNQQQRRSSTISSSSFSNNNNHRLPKYDRSVTTFDPHGQLLQIQYAQYAATQRTKRTIITMMDRIHNNIYIATSSSSSLSSSTTNTHGDETQPQPHQFVYPITKHVYFIGIGLLGDIRAMASHIRVQVQQYIYQYQEDMTVLQIANMICQLHHQCTYQSGIRPLGVTCLIFGIDDNNNDDVRIDGDGQTNARLWKLYKCTPGGSIPEDCGGGTTTTTTIDGDSDDFTCTVMGYQEETILKLIYNYEDVQSGHYNSTDDNENGTNGNITTRDTNANTTTSTSMDEADCMIHFISAIQSAFIKMDGATRKNIIGTDIEPSQLTDVYVFRSRHHHRQQRPVVSCFANIDCGSNNNALQRSLKRVRQYYNKQ